MFAVIPRRIAPCFVALFLGSGSVVGAEDKPKGDYEVHEISLWRADPASNAINARDLFDNGFPGFVETRRPAKEEGPKDKVFPFTLINFRGQPLAELEVEYQLRSATAHANWPKSDIKNKRLRWEKLKLVSDVGENPLFAYVPDRSWLSPFRSIPGTLYLRIGVRAERFLALDPEVSLAPTLKVEGGPDKLTVANGMKHPVFDVVISAPGPTPGTRRFGRIEKLAAGKGVTPSAPAPNAPAPNPGTAARTMTVAVAGAAPGQVVVVAPAAVAAPAALVPAKVADAGKVAAKAGAPATKGAPAANAGWGPAVEVTLGAPVPVKNGTVAAEQAAIEAVLVKAGASAEEATGVVAAARKQLFESTDLSLSFRLAQETLDELLPLECYPEPKKRIRSALVVVRGLDPNLKNEVSDLVKRLGNPDWQVREKAEERLLAMGTAAHAALKDALKDKDLEVVFRAERILLLQKVTF